MQRHRFAVTSLLALAALSAGCGESTVPGTEPVAEAVPEVAAAPGIDPNKKVITIGMLNDESGPVASIGRPWAVGKRILRLQVNAGGSGLLPEGWTLEYLERDHGSDPRRAVQLFNEIRDRVLFIGTSFGTPNTLPLRPLLERHRIVAFPAALSSQMRNFEFTPPVAPSYKVEAARALDWLVNKAGGPDKVKLGLVYQQDEYGRDGLEAVADAAQRLGIKVLASQAYAVGQTDYDRLVAALQEADARHVILSTVPSATGPILDVAFAREYAPLWIGLSPSWTDRFFDATLVPPQIFETYYRTGSTAFWGEKGVPFMKGFLEAYEAHGRQLSAPDYYVMLGYVQGLLTLEVTRRMIESGNLGREGFLKALRSLKDYDSRGAVADKQDFSKLPYDPGHRVRVLRPDFHKRSWEVVGPYAEPITRRPASEPKPKPAAPG